MAPSASWPGRVSTTDRPAAGELLRAVRQSARALPSWSMPSASQTTLASVAPRERRWRSPATAARRSGANGCGCTAAAVSGRGRAPRPCRLTLLRGVGGRHDHHRPALAFGLGDQPLDHERARRPLRGRRPAVVDDQHHRPGAGQRLVAVGIEHRLGQRQDDEGGGQHADQGQPPGRLRRRLLAVLDADQDAGRREGEAARAAAGWCAAATRSPAAPAAPASSQGLRKAIGPSVMVRLRAARATRGFQR